MPRLFSYSVETFERMCEDLDEFLHKSYGEPPQAVEEGDTACVLCHHPMSITSPEFRYVDEAMSVHAQCACFAQMAWMPTREMMTKVLEKRKSSTCVQCNENAPYVTCVGCALLQNDKTKCYHLTCAIKAKLYLRWDPYQFDVLCHACYVKHRIPKHLKKATWITVKYIPETNDDDDDDDAAGGDVKQNPVSACRGTKRGGSKKRPASVTFTDDDDKPTATGRGGGGGKKSPAAGGGGKKAPASPAAAGGGGGKKAPSAAAAAAAAAVGGGKKGPVGRGGKKKPALRAMATVAAVGSGAADSDVSDETPTEMYTPPHTPPRRRRSGSPLDGLAAVAQLEPVPNQMQMSSVPSAAAAAVQFDDRALVSEPIAKISIAPPEGDAKTESEEDEENAPPKYKRRKIDYRLLEIASPPKRASTRITPDVPVALRVQKKNRAAAAAATFSAAFKY